MAKDGAEAKALVDHNIFDLAILDVYLPDYNGLDLLNELKKTQPIFRNHRICTRPS